MRVMEGRARSGRWRAFGDPTRRPPRRSGAVRDDPKSVKPVDPDDLAAAFGEGVSLKDITVEITDDPVTWGMDDFDSAADLLTSKDIVGWLLGTGKLQTDAQAGATGKYADILPPL